MFIWVTATNNAQWKAGHVGNQGNDTADKHCSVIRPAHWWIPNEDVIFYISLWGKQKCRQESRLAQNRGNVELKVKKQADDWSTASWLSLNRESSWLTSCYLNRSSHHQSGIYEKVKKLGKTFEKTSSRCVQARDTGTFLLSWPHRLGLVPQGLPWMSHCLVPLPGDINNGGWQKQITSVLF